MPDQKTVVTARWVIPGPAEPTLSDAAVVIERDHIVELGDRSAMLAKHPDAKVTGSEKVAVLPGLINAHHHCHGATTIQHGVRDDLLEPWILSKRRARRSDFYLTTLLTTARELASGVTTVVEAHFGGYSAKSFSECLDRSLKAYEEAGIRVALSTGVDTQSFIVWGPGEDERFIDSLPVELRAGARGLLPTDIMSEDEYFAIMREKILYYQDHPLINVWYAPGAPHWVPDSFMQRTAQEAESLRTHVQTHCVESLYEGLYGPRFYGKSTVLHLRDLGVLSPRYSLAHGVWLTEAEIEVLAETGTAVSHNPSSNLRLWAGIAPLNALLKAGVTVGMGMDGFALNEDEDMFTEMRLALRLHRTPMLRTPSPSVDDIFALTTTGGAKVMGRSRELGRLAPGYKADLVILDLARVTSPWVAPEADPKDVVLLQAKASDVRTVYVNGEIAFADGKPTRFDVEAAARELARALDSTPYNHERARLLDSIAPHFEAWYASWPVPDLEPYTIYNSRR